MNNSNTESEIEQCRASEFAELKKLEETANQMSTQHSIIRERVQFKSKALDISLLISSAALAFLSSAKDEVINWIFAPILFFIHVTIFITVLSFIVFILSICVWRLDWKGQARAHADAVLMFSSVRRDLRRLLRDGHQSTKEERAIVKERYESIVSVAPEISEKYFLMTKRSHKLKKLQSSILDVNPGVSLLLLKLCVRLKHNKRALKNLGND